MFVHFCRTVTTSRTKRCRTTEPTIPEKTRGKKSEEDGEKAQGFHRKFGEAGWNDSQRLAEIFGDCQSDFPAGRQLSAV